MVLFVVSIVDEDVALVVVSTCRSREGKAWFSTWVVRRMVNALFVLGIVVVVAVKMRLFASASRRCSGRQYGKTRQAQASSDNKAIVALKIGRVHAVDAIKRCCIVMNIAVVCCCISTVGV